MASNSGLSGSGLGLVDVPGLAHAPTAAIWGDPVRGETFGNDAVRNTAVRDATVRNDAVRNDAVRRDAAPSEIPAVPAHMLPHRTPAQLLAAARQGLDEAARTRPDGLRYAAAHLAALRAAAAVLAARARPAPSRRSRVTSVWKLLVLVAPEFDDWAAYFALGAGKRAAAEAGIPRVVTGREADDLLRAAEQFVTVVECSLGAFHQPRLAA